MYRVIYNGIFYNSLPPPKKVLIDMTRVILDSLPTFDPRPSIFLPSFLP